MSLNQYNHLSKLRRLIVKMVAEYTEVVPLENEDHEVFVKRACATLTDEQRANLNHDVKVQAHLISFL